MATSIDKEQLERFVKFTSGEIPLTITELFSIVKNNQLSLSSLQQGKAAFCMIHHDKVKDILSQLSEIIDVYDDLMDEDEDEYEDD